MHLRRQRRDELHAHPSVGTISTRTRRPRRGRRALLYNFLVREEKTEGPAARPCELSELRPGDLIQLSFDGETFRHTPVVVSVGWPVTPENVLVAAHSYDADNRPLSTYSYQDIRFLKIFGVWHP